MHNFQLNIKTLNNIKQTEKYIKMIRNKSKTYETQKPLSVANIFNIQKNEEHNDYWAE